MWWFQPKSVTSYRVDKPNFTELKVKMAKMTLTVKAIGSPDSIQAESMIRCMQIWLFLLQFVIYRAQGKVGGQTDGQTQATTTPLKTKGQMALNFVIRKQVNNILLVSVMESYTYVEFTRCYMSLYLHLIIRMYVVTRHLIQIKLGPSKRMDRYTHRRHIVYRHLIRVSMYI